MPSSSKEFSQLKRVGVSRSGSRMSTVGDQRPVVEEGLQREAEEPGVTQRMR